MWFWNKDFEWINSIKKDILYTVYINILFRNLRFHPKHLTVIFSIDDGGLDRKINRIIFTNE